MSPTINSLTSIKPIYTKADSIITFEFEALDQDGEIVNIEFYINDKLIKTSSSNLILHNFYIANENIGYNTFKVLAFDNSQSKSSFSSSFIINDYRTPYLGEFRFTNTVVTNNFNDPITYNDTFYHEGNVSLFKLTDSQFDNYPHDDSFENPDKKLTINFGETITPTVHSNGDFIPKYGSHYYHEGKYSDNLDTIFFEFNSGSLATSSYHTVIGIRKK